MNADTALIDIVADELDLLPRGEEASFDGVAVYRQRQADPDGWEYVSDYDGLDNYRAARLLVALRPGGAAA